MALAEEQARAKGFAKLSLIVFEENDRARALYERPGYRDGAREPITLHPLIHFTGDALLVVKDL